ncbi:MAG: hypothetical protein CM15mP47_3840 [Methanobacteriota archaeon]|nr:MAG: hypothetical protein CM15mP47_3840 [Euryarchaeota archaeon]
MMDQVKNAKPRKVEDEEPKLSSIQKILTEFLIGVLRIS